MKFEGNLKITKENQGEFKNLIEVTGNVYVSGKAKLPKLETVGGNVYVSGEAKLPKLETVGGYVYVYGKAKLDAPKLETVGGYKMRREEKYKELDSDQPNNQGGGE